MKLTPGPECSVCSHDERAGIEEKLAAGVPIRDISQQMGKNGPSFHAVQRHKSNCMRTAVLAAREADAITIVEEGRTIVERCREVNREAWALLNEAKSEQDRKVYASLLGQALKSLELEAKLLGEIGPSTSVQVNTQINNAREPEPPQWARERMSELGPADAAALRTGCRLIAASSLEELIAEHEELLEALRGLAEKS